MASRSYSVRALVLRRTKLGESDVICTLLSCDGSQIRAVAKGARKPSSSFASRLEVYSVCDLLLCQGKTLDIVKEARLLEGNEHLRRDYALMEAASPMVEILDKTTQVGLEDERLFPMTCVALKALKAANLETLLHPLSVIRLVICLKRLLFWAFVLVLIPVLSAEIQFHQKGFPLVRPFRLLMVVWFVRLAVMRAKQLPFLAIPCCGLRLCCSALSRRFLILK